MDEIVQKFLRGTGPVLCVDIGSGTQDALLARPGLECENWPRFVLPAPARLVAQRIRELTEHLKNHPNDDHSRLGMYKMVGKRRRLLDYLAKKDIERYRAIIAKLGIRK